MAVDVKDLDQMQAAYKAAVEQWIAAIREEDARKKAKEAKAAYEGALREKFFNF